jgi:hypothetical protein
VLRIDIEKVFINYVSNLDSQVKERLADAILLVCRAERCIFRSRRSISGRR